MLEDDKGPLVQIVGSNVYFLIPVISDKDLGRQQQVFESMVKLAWEGLRAKPAKKKPARIRRGALKQMAQKWLDPKAKHIAEEIARCDAEIDVYRQQLAVMYRVRREYEMFRDTLTTSGFIERELSRVPEDTRRLISHPLVASVELVQDGLHVGTKQIVIEHAGRRYPVGEFVIRINQHGRVSLWNESPTHPKNESHPHINDDGTPCFGNVTDVITQAAGEHRYADAVLHVLRWLEYGYTPAIARVKIETWPPESLPTPAESRETAVPNNDGPTGNAPVAPEVFP